MGFTSAAFLSPFFVLRIKERTHDLRPGLSQIQTTHPILTNTVLYCIENMLHLVFTDACAALCRLLRLTVRLSLIRARSISTATPSSTGTWRWSAILAWSLPDSSGEGGSTPRRAKSRPGLCRPTSRSTAESRSACRCVTFRATRGKMFSTTLRLVGVVFSPWGKGVEDTLEGSNRWGIGRVMVNHTARYCCRIGWGGLPSCAGRLRPVLGLFLVF